MNERLRLPLTADVVNKGIGTGMFFIGTMNIPVFFVPNLGLDLREISLGLWGCRVNFSQAELIGQWHGLPIDTFSTDDVNLFVGTAVFEGLFKAGKYLCAGAGGVGIGREDDVSSVG